MFALPGGRRLCNSPCCVRRLITTITTPISWDPKTTSLFPSCMIEGALMLSERLQRRFETD